MPLKMNSNTTSKLTLVGAGPGDPDLITIKAIKALECADVVLYDALVNRVLLNHAAKAKKVFVGKRAGLHAVTQDRINKLIVEYALGGLHVVRLKGGDPYVFGRAAEEIACAESFGIEVEVIPGISSALAVPSSLGIGLTKRNIAESFWVISGTTSKNQLSEDIKLAALSTATVVILMGVKKLNDIVTIFKEQGKAETAVAVIQNGTTSNENYAMGTINSIQKAVKMKNISTPAIIVIGEVVKESHQLQKFYHELQGQHVMQMASPLMP